MSFIIMALSTLLISITQVIFAKHGFTKITYSTYVITISCFCAWMTPMAYQKTNFLVMYMFSNACLLVFGVVLGWLFLGSPITARHIAGFVLYLVSAYLVR